MNRNHSNLAVAGAVGAVAVALFVAWMVRPESVAGPCVVVAGPAMLPDLSESSGLAISRRTPGLIWSHNDSGNESDLYAIDPAGTVHARIRVPVRTRDWEDVSAGRCPAGDCLYIADIGDNRRSRRQVAIYRVPEPAPDDAVAGPPDVFHAKYSDGSHNAEAMVVLGSDLFIITRERASRVYRASVPPSGSGDLTFEPAGELGLTTVTDAEAARDESTVAVRTSHEVVLYRADDFARGTYTPTLRVPIDGLLEPQGEGVALDGDLLYLSSEGRPWNQSGRLVSLRCDIPAR